MSRGLGKMQRAILHAYRYVVPDAKGVLKVHAEWGEQYAEEDVCSVRKLRDQVAFSARAGQPPPEMGQAFKASFSRALHKLVEQGALVPVSQWGHAYSSFRHDCIRFVVRGKR